MCEESNSMPQLVVICLRFCLFEHFFTSCDIWVSYSLISFGIILKTFNLAELFIQLIILKPIHFSFSFY